MLNEGLPERFKRLDELANNLWWSWHEPARQLFRDLDQRLWKQTGHNAVAVLRRIAPQRLNSAAADSDYVALYDSVMAAFDAARTAHDGWFRQHYPGVLSGPVAYFSMEFAFHSSLPIYAGGLGILAGDVCKEACDLGLPLVGVGFMYPEGYFTQRISADGWQEEDYRQLDFSRAPISPVSPPGQGLPGVMVELAGRQVHLGVWQVRLGSVTVYLLDTDVAENSTMDRRLSDRLYIADRELRIQQEIVLGIGGVRILRALGITPAVWHANEGHTSFMMLERVREEVARGVSFTDSSARVRAATVFTTHTPIPAANDVFSAELVARYFQGYWTGLGVDGDTFMRLGGIGDGDRAFNMTALGMRLSDHRNAVSKLHGEVARRMWHRLWPGLPEAQVPISHITNGIHTPTWLAPEMAHLYDRYLGEGWLQKQDNSELWRQTDNIPDEELWAVHQQLKTKLLHVALERTQRLWAAGETPAEHIVAMGALLDPDVLTIGFCRRFAEYKRPSLVFRDIERIRKIVADPERPVQLIFAGKAHPADFAAKHMLHQVFDFTTNRQFLGRIAFIEDYDLHLAHYLTQGVDLWLANPRRYQEACGTSGMKAAINGAPSASIRDGWWYEAAGDGNGWSIGVGPGEFTPEAEDEADSEALYKLLEDKIVPLYYERDQRGVPHGWLVEVKEAMRTTAPEYSACRMLKEYTERYYVPIAQPVPAAAPGRVS